MSSGSGNLRDARVRFMQRSVLWTWISSKLPIDTKFTVRDQHGIVCTAPKRIFCPNVSTTGLAIGYLHDKVHLQAGTQKPPSVMDSAKPPEAANLADSPTEAKEKAPNSLGSKKQITSNVVVSAVIEVDLYNPTISSGVVDRQQEYLTSKDIEECIQGVIALEKRGLSGIVSPIWLERASSEKNGISIGSGIPHLEDHTSVSTAFPLFRYSAAALLGSQSNAPQEVLTPPKRIAASGYTSSSGFQRGTHSARRNSDASRMTGTGVQRRSSLSHNDSRCVPATEPRRTVRSASLSEKDRPSSTGISSTATRTATRGVSASTESRTSPYLFLGANSLKPGDILLSLDGTSLSEWSPQQLQQFLLTCPLEEGIMLKIASPIAVALASNTSSNTVESEQRQSTKFPDSPDSTTHRPAAYVGSTPSRPISSDPATGRSNRSNSLPYSSDVTPARHQTPSLVFTPTTYASARKGQRSVSLNTTHSPNPYVPSVYENIPPSPVRLDGRVVAIRGGGANKPSPSTLFGDHLRAPSTPTTNKTVPNPTKSIANSSSEDPFANLQSQVSAVARLSQSLLQNDVSSPSASSISSVHQTRTAIVSAPSTPLTQQRSYTSTSLSSTIDSHLSAFDAFPITRPMSNAPIVITRRSRSSQSTRSMTDVNPDASDGSMSTGPTHTFQSDDAATGATSASALRNNATGFSTESAHLSLLSTHTAVSSRRNSVSSVGTSSTHASVITRGSVNSAAYLSSASSSTAQRAALTTRTPRRQATPLGLRHSVQPRRTDVLIPVAMPSLSSTPVRRTSSSQQRTSTTPVTSSASYTARSSYTTHARTASPVTSSTQVPSTITPSSARLQRMSPASTQDERLRVGSAVPVVSTSIFTNAPVKDMATKGAAQTRPSSASNVRTTTTTAKSGSASAALREKILSKTPAVPNNTASSSSGASSTRTPSKGLVQTTRRADIDNTCGSIRRDNSLAVPERTASSHVQTANSSSLSSASVPTTFSPFSNAKSDLHSESTYATSRGPRSNLLTTNTTTLTHQKDVLLPSGSPAATTSVQRPSGIPILTPGKQIVPARSGIDVVPAQEQSPFVRTRPRGNSILSKVSYAPNNKESPMKQDSGLSAQDLLEQLADIEAELHDI